MTHRINIIDLFAGPGGLGEGFTGYCSHTGEHPFRIAMSVESEPSAHQTLQLRAFFRQFSDAPATYYNYVQGLLKKEALYSTHPQEAEKAITETLYKPRRLGDKGADDQAVREQLRKLLKKRNEPWVLIGGPPCQAYSLVGRARNRGITDYKPENDGRHFLYEEYLSVLDLLAPEVFVMENVKGILSSKVNGELIFPRLLSDLRKPRSSSTRGRSSKTRYRLFSLTNGQELNGDTTVDGSPVIRCENYGIPQARHRVILLGVREDVCRKPEKLRAVSHYSPVEQMLDRLPALRSGLSKRTDSHEAWLMALRSSSHKVAAELNRRGLDGDLASKAVEDARSVSSRGARFVASRKSLRTPTHLANWIQDENLRGISNHETRGHMEADLARYLYSACFAQASGGRSPKSDDFPDSLAPLHSNWSSGKFADRFRVQSKGKPSTTITSHISKDGHYYIHYDPRQCRSLTVREAARLQTFPDNYHFEGNRTQQYVQVGNAVPPWLARQIASIVYGLLE